MRFHRTLLDVDLYAVLGVPPDATPEQIRRRYRRLASISHPDLNPSDMRRAERRMAQINVAAGVLLDPHKRALYDGQRSHRPRRPSHRPPSPPIDISRVRLDARDLEWIARLRTWPARCLATFDAWTEGWSPEFRVTFLCASMAMAFGLIRLANPSSLPSPFEDERQPTARLAVPAAER
jgi:DnaJ domain